MSRRTLPQLELELELAIRGSVALRLCLGAGLMEATSMEVMNAPFRKGLYLPVRLAYDGLAGAVGAIAFLFMLRWILKPRMTVHRLKWAPLVAAGAIFLSAMFALEVLIERIFLSLGWGRVTLFWNGIVADSSSVLILFSLGAFLYNRMPSFRVRFEASSAQSSVRSYLIRSIDPVLAIYLAGYEGFMLAAQLGAVPWLARAAYVHGYADYVQLVFFTGWFLGGASAALITVSFARLKSRPYLLVE